MTRLKTLLRRWHADETGSIAVETIMMVPLLAWALLSTLAYFDAYRMESISTKAGLTIADMLSREKGYVTNPYINNTRKLLRFLTIEEDWPDLRISVVKWEGSRNRYRRVWSQERGPRDPLRNADMAALAPRLPVLADEERLIVVETWTEYTPLYSVGLEPFTMNTFTFIRPRFVDKLCYKPQETTPDDDAVC